MRITIADIAEKAGKNRSTVSRVLRGDASFPVSEASRQKILQIARDLNYVPAHSARSLATGRSYCVAVVLGDAEKDLGEPTFAAVLVEMVRTFLKHDYHLTLLPMDTTAPSDKEVLEMVRGQRVDGFYVGTSILGTEALGELTSRKVPLVTTELDPKIAHSGLVDVVRRDTRAGLAALVAELVQQGHRRVAFVAPDYVVQHRLPVFSSYLPIFRQLMRDAGAEHDPTSDFIYKPTVRGMLASRAEARAAAEREIDRLREHTAIVANSDLVAMGVADAMRTVGLEAGRDYALVGNGNVEQSSSYPTAKPFLTTIDPDYRQRGRRIAELLLRRIAQPDATPEVCDIAPRLIVRQSMIRAQSGSTDSP